MNIYLYIAPYRTVPIIRRTLNNETMIMNKLTIIENGRITSRKTLDMGIECYTDAQIQCTKKG